VTVLVRFDYSKLRGRIKEIYHTENSFAQALGISTVSLSKRLNNRIGFDSPEMHRACELLRIPLDDAPKYFFAKQESLTT
jgi:hypothetical protein